MGIFDRAFPKAGTAGPTGAPGPEQATAPFAALPGGAPPAPTGAADSGLGRGPAPGAPLVASGVTPVHGAANGHGGLPPGGGSPVAPPDLMARRHALAERLAELQWDLGGLAYEMAIRDHFRLDVIVRRAATLQQVDAELAEVEHILRLEQVGAAGSCPSCGALHPRGAAFCWRCGNQLLEVITPA